MKLTWWLLKPYIVLLLASPEEIYQTPVLNVSQLILTGCICVCWADKIFLPFSLLVAGEAAILSAASLIPLWSLWGGVVCFSLTQSLVNLAWCSLSPTCWRWPSNPLRSHQWINADFNCFLNKLWSYWTQQGSIFSSSIFFGTKVCFLQF